MVSAGDITPEKQLLNLIEDPKTKDKKAYSARGALRGLLSVISPAAWLGRISFFRGRMKKRSQPQGLSITAVNHLLAVLIIAAAGYLGYSVYGAILGMRQTSEFTSQPVRQPEEVTFPEVGVLKEQPTFYLEKVNQRNIFRIGGESSGALDDTETAIRAARLQDEIKHLRLVGISWSDSPDAMVEDTKTMQTFFVTRGEMIGDFKVEAIFKDHLILSFGGEEVELK